MTNEERTELVKRLMTSVTLTFTIPGGAQAADQIETDGDRIKELEAEVERLREELAAAYVDQPGTVQHASDCATSNAPAMKPGPCDCAALGKKQ